MRVRGLAWLGPNRDEAGAGPRCRIRCAHCRDFFDGGRQTLHPWSPWLGPVCDACLAWLDAVAASIPTTESL